MTLELRDICLKYTKKTVLQNLSLSFKGGQIHALLGENGAGKSTAANIICGELKPDSGQILLDGQTVCFDSPKAAIEHGICYVHQTPMLAKSISVKENLLLGIKKEYKENIPLVIKEWLKDVNPNCLVKELGGGQRFFIALCSALIKKPRLLILDEPSALLDDIQREFLFTRLRLLADGGMNILIITHNHDEAETWCDTVDFLEDGHLAEKKKITNLSAQLKEEATKTDKDAETMTLGSVTLTKGKITLIQGLAQDGLDTLEQSLLSLLGSTASFALQNLVSSATQSLTRSDYAFIPTDRKYTGSNPNLTVLQMLTSALDAPEKQKPELALTMIKNAGVNITPFEKCRNLSGGMLQKLLFEREFYNNPQLIILCNPLQGLDPDTCLKSCRRIKQAADSGAYVLVLSYGAFPPEFSDIHYLLRKGKLEAA